MAWRPVVRPRTLRCLQAGLNVPGQAAKNYFGICVHNETGRPIPCVRLTSGSHLSPDRLEKGTTLKDGPLGRQGYITGRYDHGTGYRIEVPRSDSIAIQRDPNRG